MAECDPEPSRARLWVNARLATMATGTAGLGVIDDGAILSFDGRIVHAGFAADVPTSMDAERIDCGGRWVTPGLIDCHTHLVFGGDRSDDFQRRLRGESYESIARSGGGIDSTVRATRAADFSSLVESALPRLDALMAEGVTTVEVKSGYGLEAETELRQLRAARELGRRRPVTVFSTFLGAHGLPPEAPSREGYLDALIGDILPRVVAGELADAADAFCETIAFSPREVSRFLDAARAAGLPVKLHADQLSNLGGATLAAGHGALSADHLEHCTDEGAAAMARAGTVAVLLPGAFYFLRETRVPPIKAFRQHGVRIAVATDCNPGTSPLTSLLLAMNMAATTMRLTVEECLLGVTREAARALGRLHDVGTLEPGKSCDLAIWNVGSLAELVYRMGFNPLHARIWRGR